MQAQEQIHFICYDQRRLNKVHSDFEQKCVRITGFLDFCSKSEWTLLPRYYIDPFYKCKIQKLSFSPYLLFSSHRHLWADCLQNVGASTSHNTMGLHTLLQDSFTFFFALPVILNYSFICM
jgi:hypothetical protein